MQGTKKQFWKIKTLGELTNKEWELLCDSCGRCCLHKFEDESTDKIYFTDVVCYYLIDETCKCSVYKARQSYVPDCLTIKPGWGDKFNWLPNTCAYKLLSKDKDLPIWHPLISGYNDTVHLAGISVRGRVFRDNEVKEKDFYKHIIDWVE